MHGVHLSIRCIKHEGRDWVCTSAWAPAGSATTSSGIDQMLMAGMGWTWFEFSAHAKAELSDRKTGQQHHHCPMPTARLLSSLLAGAAHPGCTDGMEASVQFNHPRGLDCDSKGRVILCDWHNHCIRSIDHFGAPLATAHCRRAAGKQHCLGTARSDNVAGTASVLAGNPTNPGNVLRLPVKSPTNSR